MVDGQVGNPRKSTPMLRRRIFFLISFVLFLQMAGANSFSDSIKVYNAGINGNNTADLLARIDRDVFCLSPDIVILMIGTNDMLNTRNILSLQEYENNYRQLVTQLKQKGTLMVMTIPPVYSPYIIKRKPELNFKENGPQQRIDSANALIKKLALENKCILLDLHRVLMTCGGSDEHINSLFQNEANRGVSDGVHPTAIGYRVIATAVYSTIHALNKPMKKVLCFGDSITFGYNVKGGGTTDGESYPALLQKMLSND